MNGSMVRNPAPDVTWKDKPYRLAEPGRSEGASVRYGAVGAPCEACGKAIVAARAAVRLPDRTTWLHVPCAIGTAALAEQAPAARQTVGAR